MNPIKLISQELLSSPFWIILVGILAILPLLKYITTSITNSSNQKIKKLKLTKDIFDFDLELVTVKDKLLMQILFQQTFGFIAPYNFLLLLLNQKDALSAIIQFKPICALIAISDENQFTKKYNRKKIKFTNIYWIDVSKFIAYVVFGMIGGILTLVTFVLSINVMEGEINMMIWILTIISGLFCVGFALLSLKGIGADNQADKFVKFFTASFPPQTTLDFYDKQLEVGL